MKTSFITHKVAGFSLSLLFSAFLASNAVAGPGSQYWQSVGKPAAPAVEQAKPATVAMPGCPGSELIPVTVMKSTQTNGRPPLVPVQIGTERVCHLCTTTKVITTNDWPSHRGPLVQKTEVTMAGVTHVCTTGCMPSPKA